MCVILIFIIFYTNARLTVRANQIYQQYNELTLSDEYIDIIRSIAPEFTGKIKLSDIASYTVNKKDIFLKLEPEADLKRNLEIILHEISHCLTEQVGHGEEFQLKLKELKDRAKAHGYL